MSNRKLQEFRRIPVWAAERVATRRQVPRQRRAVLRERRRHQDLDGRARHVRVPPLLREGCQQVDRGHEGGRGDGRPVGRQGGAEPDLPSFRRKPYKVRKVTGRKRKPGKKQDGQAVCKTRESGLRKGGGQGRAVVQAGARAGTARRPRPRRSPSPKPKQGLPGQGGQVAKNAGKTGVRGRQVEGEALPLPLGLPQFEPGFYGLL